MSFSLVASGIGVSQFEPNLIRTAATGKQPKASFSDYPSCLAKGSTIRLGRVVTSKGEHDQLKHFRFCMGDLAQLT